MIDTAHLPLLRGALIGRAIAGTGMLLFAFGFQAPARRRRERHPAIGAELLLLSSALPYPDSGRTL